MALDDVVSSVSNSPSRYAKCPSGCAVFSPRAYISICFSLISLKLGMRHCPACVTLMGYQVPGHFQYSDQGAHHCR